MNQVAEGSEGNAERKGGSTPRERKGENDAHMLSVKLSRRDPADTTSLSQVDYRDDNYATIINT